MSLPIEALEAELLRLPSVERARLLDRVVASLDADTARDEAWDKLAALRDAEIESGASVPVSGPEAVERIRAELLWATPFTEVLNLTFWTQSAFIAERPVEQ
jgi:Putative addiction module component